MDAPAAAALRPRPLDAETIACDRVTLGRTDRRSVGGAVIDCIITAIAGVTLGHSPSPDTCPRHLPSRKLPLCPQTH